MQTYLLNVRSQFGHIEARWLNLTIPYLDVEEYVSQWIPFLEVIERLINISTIYKDVSPGGDSPSVIDDLITELADNHAEILAGVDSSILLHMEEIFEQGINRLMQMGIFGGQVINAERLDKRHMRDDGFLLIKMH